MKTLKRITAGLLSVALILSAVVLCPRRTAAVSQSVQQGADNFANNYASATFSSAGISPFTQNAGKGAQFVGNFGSGLMGAAGIANNVMNLTNNHGAPGHSQGQQLLQALSITADLTFGMVGLAMTLGGVAAGPAFVVAAIAIGVINGYLWSDEGMAMMDAIENWFKPSEDANVYKPNIYLYTAEATEVEITFARPELVTVSIPEYRSGWKALAHDGLVRVDGTDYGFLFYEAKTNPALYDYEEAFFIPAAGRAAVFGEILAAYNFTAREIADFVEFWDEMLGEADFLMYPQLTATVDRTMPMTVSADFAEYFRIWFAFTPYEGQAYAPAAPVYSDRTNESTLLEWGGFILE